MWFLLSLLSYLATICVAVVIIIASINYVVPRVPPPAFVTADVAPKAKQLSPRALTRKLASEEAQRVIASN